MYVPMKNFLGKLHFKDNFVEMSMYSRDKPKRSLNMEIRKISLAG